MILTNRLFERVPPNRDAKSIFIFCEGVRRESQYFKYFGGLDSRIKIMIYELDHHEDNSPLGLLNNAEKCLVKTKENPNPPYSFIEGDEVWIVLDVDKDKDESREPQIQAIRVACNGRKNWRLAISNPCFEVWLYYHLHSTKPVSFNSEKCSEWKQFVNSSIPGGFDSRKHPIFIESASINAEKNFELVNGKLALCSTDVYHLANSIVPLLRSKLQRVIDQIK